MSSKKYLESITEVTQFLSVKGLDEFVYLLLDNGYDDLDAISRANDSEIAELEAVFPNSESKKGVRALAIALRSFTIEKYRAPGGEKDFQKLVNSDGKSSKDDKDSKKSKDDKAAEKSEKADKVSDLKPVDKDKQERDRKATTIEARRASMTPKTSAKPDEKTKEKEKEKEKEFSVSVNRSSYLCVRSSEREAWADKWVVLDNGTLKTLTTRKEATTDQSWSLTKVLSSVKPVDPKTVKLNLQKSEWIELWAATGLEIEDWSKDLTRCIPGAASAASSSSSSSSTASKNSEDKKKRPADDSDSDSDDAKGKDEDDDDDESSKPSPNVQGKNRGSAQTLKVSPEEFDAAIKEQAAITAKALNANACGDAPPEEKKRSANPSPAEKKLNSILNLLTTGAVFKKYKRGNMSKRMIWVTPMFDFLIWGDELKTNIKGFMATKTIEEINQGFGKNITKVYVVAAGRTLEIEAKDTPTAKEWVEALEALIQLSKAVEEKRKEGAKAIKEKEKEAKSENSKLLIEGDIFKKWPGKKMLQKGFTVRKIWATSGVDKLNWGESGTGKVKGSLDMVDVLYVQEDDQDKSNLKFTVWAKGRALDLEAKTTQVRDKFIRALRFYVEAYKTNPPPPSATSTKSKSKDNDKD